MRVDQGVTLSWGDEVREGGEFYPEHADKHMSRKSYMQTIGVVRETPGGGLRTADSARFSPMQIQNELRDIASHASPPPPPPARTHPTPTYRSLAP